MIALNLLKRVAKCLKLLEFAFSEQLFDDLREKVYVAVLIVQAVLLPNEGSKLRVTIALFCADDD